MPKKKIQVVDITATDTDTNVVEPDIVQTTETPSETVENEVVEKEVKEEKQLMRNQ